MALPTSRDQTFGWQSIVPSAVLNSIQDAIIALNTAVTGMTDYGADIAALEVALAALDASVDAALAALNFNEVTGDLHLTGDVNADGDVNATGKLTFGERRTLVIPAFSGFDANTTRTWFPSGDGEFRRYIQSVETPTSKWLIPLPVESGMNITVRMRVRHPTSTDVQTICGIVYHCQGEDVPVTAGPGIASSGTVDLQTLTVVANHVVVAEHRYWLSIYGDYPDPTPGTARWIFEALVDWKWV